MGVTVNHWLAEFESQMRSQILTHHTYMHSRYKDEILPKVESYLKIYKEHGH